MHLGSVEIGGIRVDAIDGGTVWMDGGSIFGVVPKTLWREATAADDQNRVPLYFFSLLVRTGNVTVVIEAGSAAHQPARVREYYAADESRLPATLAQLGVDAGDVDFFIPSHLHFDHAGGASNAEGTRPLFPRARYVLQRTEWEEARHPMPVNKNAYLPGDIAPLESANLLVVDGCATVAPGIEVIRTGGHSVGHQFVKVGFRPSETVIFVGDVVPMSEHVSPRWMCAFDIDPVTTYNAKVDVLNWAAAEGAIIAPGHAGRAPLFTVSRDDRGRYSANCVPSISPPKPNR